MWPDGWVTHFIISVDGIHCKYHEEKHPVLSKDPALSSHKFGGKPGLAYELALSIFESKLVWMKGPEKPKNNDRSIYVSELKNKIPPGKKVVADRGYRNARDPTVATPNSHDPEELRTFKARARMRQETFNGRIHNYKCMAVEFRHGIERHETCFESICVILCYEMELVSPLFDV